MNWWARFMHCYLISIRRLSYIWRLPFGGWQMALGHLAPGKLALETNGAWDIWRLRQFPPWTFPVWHLAFRTIGAWIFGGRDISRPRLLALGLLALRTIGARENSCSRHLAAGLLVVGTIGAQEISRPDFWRLGHLALSRRPIYQDISWLDYWCSGHFPP